MSKDEDWNERVKVRKKWLSEPFMDMFDENTFRIRRNLMIICSVVLVYKFAATGVSPESSFLGVKLEGVKPESIDIILAIGVIYFLIHFIWSGWDKFREWKLRLTGMPIPKATNATYPGGGHETGTHNQRQSTLSSWWAANTKFYTDKDIYAENKVDFDDAAALNTQSTVNQIKDRLNELVNKGAHIEAYLERYEQGFNVLQRSQRFRWFLIEFSLPIAMAILSLYKLILTE